MFTKSFGRKMTVMMSAVVLILALCATLLVACGDKPADGGNDIAVTSITLSKSELSLEVGGEFTLTATVSPDNATDKSVTWTSSAPSIATVKDGKVTAVASGSATITAKAGEKSATCTVTVAAATDGLAGKTFALDKIEGTQDGENMDEQTKTAYFNMNKGTTYEFGTDGTFAQKVVSQAEGMPNMLVEGTYTLDGTTLTLTPTSASMDGQPMDVSTIPHSPALTFDGTYLVIESGNGQGTNVQLFFKAANA